MSLSGKLLRGMKWYNFRSAIELKDHGVFGNLFLPEEILVDPHKMEELDFYVEFIKVRDEKKVLDILEQIMIFDMSNKNARMVHEAGKLLNEDLYSKEYKKKLAEEVERVKKEEEKARKEAEKLKQENK